jgi:hypothetical protein
MDVDRVGRTLLSVAFDLDFDFDFDFDSDPELRNPLTSPEPAIAPNSEMHSV